METKRSLTQTEISEILDFVLMRKQIPYDIAKSHQENIQLNLREQLEQIKIYPNKINELKKVIEMKFLTTQIPAGSMVGALAATSIGEPMTQLVLNSFHSSGIAKSNVTTGIPRMEELINVTSSNKMCGMRVFLKDNDHTDVVSLRNICKENIEYYSFSDIITNKSISSIDKLKENHILKNIDSKDFEDWHDYHSLMVSDDYKMCNWCVVFEVNRSKLFQIKKTLIDLVDIITSCVSDVHTVCSDEETSLLLCYVNIPELMSIEALEKKKNKNTEDELSKYSFINEDNKHYYYLRDIVLPDILAQSISGIPGVSECIYDQPLGASQIDGKKVWVVNTRGSNFREMLNHPLVDHTRTTSSRLKEIENVLGIEAARSFLLNEFASIISSSKRHIEQLVNCMTFTGRVRAANRHGIDKSVGVLAQMSFEQPIKNAVNASLNNQTDILSGVSSQLMLGKLAKIGTGYVEVLLDTKKLFEYSLEKKEEKSANNNTIKYIPQPSQPYQPFAKSSKSAKTSFQQPSQLQKIKTVETINVKKSTRSNAGEIISRKTFTVSQLKPVFKVEGIVEKEKHERFYQSTNKKVERKIQDDINVKVQRAKYGLKQENSNSLGDVIEF